MIVIGISGKKNSGKDTVAHILLNLLNSSEFYPEECSPFIRSFGDALKEEVAFTIAEPAEVPYKNLLQKLYTAEKEQYRLLLQWWGTEFRRNMFGQNYWVERMEEWIKERQFYPNPYFIVPDVRFTNELNYVIGAADQHYLIRVERPGLSGDNHASETELDEFFSDANQLKRSRTNYYIVQNNSTLEALQQHVESIAKQITQQAA